MKKNLYFILIIILICSCQFTVKSGKNNLGIMPEVKAQYFENIYVVDEKVCETKELPVTRFAVEYPSIFEVETPNDKQNHIIVKKIIDNIVTEEFTIGNSTLNLKNENLALELLENLSKNLKQQFPDLEIVSVGKKNLNGVMTYLFEGKVDYSDFIDQGYNGIYKVMCLLPIPKQNPDVNAVLITFIANEQSDIKEFSDFATNGMIGQVYKTFRYIE